MQGSPPANGGYMIAGYVVTAIIVVVYVVALWRRARRVEGELKP